jgi:hypothetical protein
MEASMRRIILSVIISAMMLSGIVVYAEEPALNVNLRLHPNIAAAQRLSRQAYNKIVAAQKANEYDMEGHAQKAKELLDQVNEELKLAAEASNKHKGK